MSLDEVKQKVMLDLFAAPGTLLPIVTGISSLLLSWAVGGDPTANAIGIIGVLGGIGHFTSRVVLGLESMTQTAYDAIRQREEDKRNEALDRLEQQLTADRDQRTENCLRNLRHVYAEFQRNCQTNRLNIKHPQLINQVEEIFQASVSQLQRSLELYQLSERLTGATRSSYLAEREKVIGEVLQTRDHLNATIQQFHAFALKRDDTDLSRLRSELDETLQVAQRTQQRMSEIGHRQPDYNPSEFQ
jgi:hypothetical protein